MRDPRRNTILLVGALNGLGYGLVFPVAALYGERAGLSFAAITALVGLHPLMRLLAGPVWGRLADRIGRRPVLLAGVLLQAVGHLVFGLAGAAWGLGLGRALTGLGSGEGVAANAAMADLTNPEERAQGLGELRAATGVGMLAGPILGGVLGLGDLAWPGLAAAVGCVISAGVVWAQFRETRGADLPAVEDRREPGRGGGDGQQTPTLARTFDVGASAPGFSAVEPGFASAAVDVSTEAATRGLESARSRPVSKGGLAPGIPSAELGFPSLDGPTSRAETELRPRDSVRDPPVAPLALAVVGACAASMALAECIVPLAIEHVLVPTIDLGMPARDAALVLSVGVILAWGLTTAVFDGALSARIVARFGELPTARVGLAGWAVAFALTPPVYQLGVVPGGLAVALTAVPVSLAGVGLASWISRQAGPARQGAASGAVQSAMALGEFVGPAVSGALFTRWYGLPYLAGSGVLVLALIAALALRPAGARR